VKGVTRRNAPEENNKFPSSIQNLFFINHLNLLLFTDYWETIFFLLMMMMIDHEVLFVLWVDVFCSTKYLFHHSISLTNSRERGSNYHRKWKKSSFSHRQKTSTERPHSEKSRIKDTYIYFSLYNMFSTHKCNLGSNAAEKRKFHQSSWSRGFQCPEKPVRFGSRRSFPLGSSVLSEKWIRKFTGMDYSKRVVSNKEISK
jgi:hypothetical protein